MSLRVIKGGDSAPAQGLGVADYIWLDPQGKMGVKTRVIPVGTDIKNEPVPIIERWTARIDGELVILSPCHYLPDPLRSQPAFISLCEIRDRDDVCPPFNLRNVLRRLLGTDQTVWWGFRQGYALSDPATHKDQTLVMERHLGACIDAGLMIHSAGSSWFKVGSRGMPPSIDPDAPTALVVADHLLIARFMLTKVAREYGLTPDFRTSRCSAFFSTEEMRSRASTGLDLAETIVRLGGALARDGDTSWTPSLRAGVVAAQGGLECVEDQNLPGDIDPYLAAFRLAKAIRTET